MDDLKEPPTGDANANANANAPAWRPRRRWLAILLYILAAFGLLALGLVGLAFYQHGKEEKVPERVAIDDTAVIDNVMTETYGKYSTAKKGWLYVDDDNRTYLMRVVQKTKIEEGAAGEELYFIASGAATDGAERAVYGAFYVYPSKPHDGGLTQINSQAQYNSAQAVRPEDVHFEALSEDTWGWVVKVRSGGDPKVSPVTVVNRVLAPHGDGIALLAQFKAAYEYDPGIPCDEAKANWDAYDAWVPPETENEDVEEPEEVLRCEKRTWTYRTGNVNGNTLVPITVTAGGTLDGQPVEAKKWKLMFDTKSFSYNVPAELQE